MNKLVEYLAKHYHPGGAAFKIVWTFELIEKSGFSVEEIHEMAMEAYEEKMVLIGRLRVKGNRWGVDQMIPGDIDDVAITRKGLQWAKCQKLRMLNQNYIIQPSFSQNKDTNTMYNKKYNPLAMNKFKVGS